MFVLVFRHIVVRAEVKRRVTCQKCGRSYTHRLARRAAIDTLPFPPLVRSAEAICHRRVSRRLQSAVEPVSCPGCAFVQPSMIPELRRRTARPARTIGVYTAVASGCLAILFLLLGAFLRKSTAFASVDWFGLAAAMLLFIAAGGVLIVLRSVLGLLRYRRAGFVSRRPLGSRLLLPDDQPAPVDAYQAVMTW